MDKNNFEQRFANMYAKNLLDGLSNIRESYPLVYSKLESEYSENVPAELLDMLFENFECDDFTLDSNKFTFMNYMLTLNYPFTIQELVSMYDNCYIITSQNTIVTEYDAGKYIVDDIMKNIMDKLTYKDNCIIKMVTQLIDIIGIDGFLDLIDYQKLYQQIKPNSVYCDVKHNKLTAVLNLNE